MTKKRTIFVAVVIILGGAFSIHLNCRDWFQPKSVQIHHTSLSGGRLPPPGPRGAAIASAGAAVMFGFDRPFKLTSIKVVPLAAFQTNKYAPPVWDLVSDSNSIPITGFSYGQRIPGMRPMVRDTQPAPLEPGVTYRLVVEAGSIKGEHDFEAAAGPAVGR